MGYIPINVKSGYSFFASSLHVEDIVNYGQTLHNDTVCLCDGNNLFGALELVSLAKKNNLKYALGVQIIIEDETPYPLLLLIKNNEGYTSLTRLSKEISSNDLTSKVQLTSLKNKLAGLYLVIPTISSKMYQIYQTDQSQVLSFLSEISKICDNIVLGLECYENNQLEYLEFCRSLNLQKCIANQANHYSFKDYHVLDVLSAIKNDSLFQKSQPTNTALDNLTYLSKVFTAEELELNQVLLASCAFDIYANKARLVEYKLKDARVSKKDYLSALANKGLAKRLNNKIPKQYYERLDYELAVIDSMGFTNYFLVVWDYVKYAKQHAILVGPGRGSGPGSLVAYVLGITDVDPLKYGLLFERFLNPERITMPDLDVDFIDTRRDEIVDYLLHKYSEQHAAHVIAFQTFQAKQAIRDAARTMGLTPKEVDILINRLPREHLFRGASLQSMYTNNLAFRSFIDGREKYRNIYEFASKLEGLPRQTSLHAAGVVLSKQPLEEVVPIYKNGPSIAVQYSKDYVESVGLLKMDILGLSNLSIIDKCLKNIQQQTGQSLNLNIINYDESGIYDMLNNDFVAGLFQISSVGMRKAIRLVQPNCFNDIVAVLALYRPGPMEFITDYANCKNKHYQVDYIDSSLQSILQPTYGIIVFQEQIMEILKQFAGFSLGEADVIRRAISKKSEKDFLEFKDKFYNKAKELGHLDVVINRVSDLIVKFANYGFNKAHSVSYAMITMQMAYLKYHYPAAFYSACLDNPGSGSTEKTIFPFIDEIKRRGLGILPPSINHSGDVFKVEDNKIRFSLQTIKGISNLALSRIIQEQNQQPFSDFYDFMERLYNRGVDINQVNNLIDAGAFDEFGLTRTTLKKGLSVVITYLNVAISRKDGLFAFDEQAEKPQLDYYQDIKQEIVDNEIAVLGTYFIGYPFDDNREVLNKHNYLTLSAVLKSSGTIKTVIYAREIMTLKTKNQETMAIIKGVDQTAQIRLVIYPTVYQTVSHLLKMGECYYVEGSLQKRQDLSLAVQRLALYRTKTEVK